MDSIFVRNQFVSTVVLHSQSHPTIENAIRQIIYFESRFYTQFSWITWIFRCQINAIEISIYILSLSYWCGSCLGRRLYANSHSHTYIIFSGTCCAFGLMRVQERNVKISVTISTPSPVDVVETIAVGSVANKCVNFISQSVSIINDRAVVSKLVVDNTTPFRQRIITPVHESKSGCVVAEIRPKHMCGTSCYRTRPINAIFHLNSTSAMIHQCCHCIGLLVRIISTYILLQHFIIVIRC